MQVIHEEFEKSVQQTQDPVTPTDQPEIPDSAGHGIIMAI